MELLDDHQLKERAIRALGELADERALEPLLKIANDPEHSFQAEAGEALGHMGKSEKSGEIFAILERFARGDNYEVVHALKGLRWLDTQDAWKVIRRRLSDKNFSWREETVALLGHNDDPATCDLLLRILREDSDMDVIRYALHAASKLFDEQSLEPSFAVLQNEHSEYVLDDEDREKILGRVLEQGDPSRLLALLPKLNEDVQGRITASLLQRDPPPVEEARAALSNDAPEVVEAAARILGRTGQKGVKEIATAIPSWRDKWAQRHPTPLARRLLR